ncbi:hypothetical protein O181_036697 [Austropuccinia psidii MF-1]|uniref:CBS domain-containing protein n=1 Tax=Austropuccinia psidii MF-1 TaxID=1389203 RepID=A0A9Q3DB76_9BASI|nr:hypothetical protein [Austropuccinia psidii MF-1]
MSRIPLPSHRLNKSEPSRYFDLQVDSIDHQSHLPSSSNLHPQIALNFTQIQSSPSNTTMSYQRNPPRPGPPRSGGPYSEDGLGTASPAQRTVGSNNPLSETRQRQSRRDEAIRKKIENELMRKRPGQKKSTNQNTHGTLRPRRQAGTVSALKPLPALTVPDNITVAEASQLCAAKRTDCVLVVDESEHLCGIFTAKDLAFRVIGDGLDPRCTMVSAIMTRNPMVTRDTTSATEALTTMVTRGFRHLPVCNEEGDVIGLLDITKVFQESLEKLERAYGSSQKLYNAIEGVQSEFGSGPSNPGLGQVNPLMAYVEALRDKMSFPDLGSILDARTAATTVGVRTSVKDAATLMREHHTTAVCVMENDGRKIAGIFTSKDVVLRVIAAGLDAKTCSVVRVMTPHPDTALPSLSIQEALRKMHDGHYLNLPVVDESGQLQGCVDVLKLTYATLEQVNSISSDGQTDESSGPVWNRFFASFAQAGSIDEDSTSVLSGSHVGPGEPHPATPNTRLKTSQYGRNIGLETPGSEITPNDSASVLQDELESSFAAQSLSSSQPHAAANPLDYEDGTYLFKFIAPSGSAHRFQARYDNYEFVREIILGKIEIDPFISEYDPTSSLPRPDPNDFQLAYFDDDNDLVLISSDQEIIDSVNVAKKQLKDRVVLHLRGGKSWGDAELTKKKNANLVTRMQAVTEAEEIKRDEDEEKEARESPSEGASKTRKKQLKMNVREGDAIAGVSKELFLPAAIGFLGVVILGVFLASRPSR